MCVCDVGKLAGPARLVVFVLEQSPLAFSALWPQKPNMEKALDW